MRNYVSLSPSEYDEITGSLYELIQDLGEVEFDDDDFELIEETVLDLINRLNEKAIS